MLSNYQKLYAVYNARPRGPILQCISFISIVQWQPALPVTGKLKRTRFPVHYRRRCCTLHIASGNN